jgi:hypothetical protein
MYNSADPGLVTWGQVLVMGWGKLSTQWMAGLGLLDITHMKASIRATAGMQLDSLGGGHWAVYICVHSVLCRYTSGPAFLWGYLSGGDLP